jgi:hypothetical protein
MTKHITTATPKRLLLVALLSLGCVSIGAQAAEAGASSYGSEAPQTAAAKLISLTPQTKSINVDNGETVTFVHGHQMFTWNFRTLRDADNFKLSDIAPAGFEAGGVDVYVARDPLYR